MRAKPVDLPPPNLVLRPKIEMFSSLALRVWASFTLMSDLETFESSGWISSITEQHYEGQRVFAYALSAAEKRVLQEFASV